MLFLLKIHDLWFGLKKISVVLVKNKRSLALFAEIRNLLLGDKNKKSHFCDAKKYRAFSEISKRHQHWTSKALVLD